MKSRSASSTSRSVELQPSENRMVARASAGVRPMAERTWEGRVDPEVQAAPALAQDAQKPAEPATEPAGEKKAEPAKKKLLDSQGREYRVCDMCGGNMYKAENTWTCEQCGFSYEE